MEIGKIHDTEIFKAVSSLQVPFGLEHSFRIVPKAIYCDRFLLMVAKQAIAGDPNLRIDSLLQELQMPLSLLEASRQVLPSAKFVHFGYEQGASGVIYKIYFEVELRPDSETDPDGTAPTLQHVAFKWNPQHPEKHAIAKYYAPLHATDEQVMRQVSESFSSQLGQVGKELDAMLQLVRERSNRDKNFLYLHVAEDGNPRESFAITMYIAELTIGDFVPNIRRICESLDAPFDHLSFDDTAILGNVAAGTHRTGEPFVTFYFGASDTIVTV